MLLATSMLRSMTLPIREQTKEENSCSVNAIWNFPIDVYWKAMSGQWLGLPSHLFIASCSVNDNSYFKQPCFCRHLCLKQLRRFLTSSQADKGICMQTDLKEFTGFLPSRPIFCSTRRFAAVYFDPGWHSSAECSKLVPTYLTSDCLLWSSSLTEVISVSK